MSDSAWADATDAKPAANDMAAARSQRTNGEALITTRLGQLNNELTSWPLPIRMRAARGRKAERVRDIDLSGDQAAVKNGMGGAMALHDC